MSETSAEFDAAVAAAKQLPEKPDNDTLLEIYALYKQSTDGDVSGEKPGFFDYVGVAKNEAWQKLQGTEATTAQQQYIDLISRLGG